MQIAKPRKGSKMGKILSTVANAAIAFSRYPSRTSLSVYRAMRDFKELQSMSDQQLRIVSRYLVARKYVLISRDGAGARLELTEKGKLYVEREALNRLKPKRLSKWDGKWRVVMFDVPNDKKSARDAFAAILKRFDFQRLQKSVFVSPHPCEEELEIVADYFDISDDVDIVIAQSFSREAEYRRLFKL